MRFPLHIRQQVALIVICAFTAIVFTVDLLTPPAVDVWVFYLPVILAPVWNNSTRQILIIALVCSLLVAIGSFSFPFSIPPLFDAMNRSMDILALWMTACAAITIAHRSLKSKQLEDEVLHITEREQSRIGRELHDSVGQELTGLGLMANALRESTVNPTKKIQIADRMVEEIERIHEQVKILSRGLMPVLVESKGLWAALDDLAETTSSQAGIPVLFECIQPCDVSSHTIATELFRIAQEAVSNALRHGQPDTIRLSLHSQVDSLCLMIEDDGIGIKIDTEHSTGMGLRIMEYRARQLGGALSIASAPGAGTLVTCRLPAKTNGHSRESQDDAPSR